jgi:N-acetylglutamate synthase-like GNAT family acetyltransferase
MTGTLRVRRATVEDLDRLRTLWSSAHLPVSDLEPRLTEFQIAEAVDGKIVASIGLEVSGTQGRLHNEAFGDFTDTDAAQELLWKRLQTLATNHGVLRVWTKEKSPFWQHVGLKPAAADELKKLPSAWNATDPGWLTLQLKNEEVINAAEREMTLFMDAQRKNAQQTVQSMKAVKTMATFIGILLTIAAFAAAFYLIMKRAELMRH